MPSIEAQYAGLIPVLDEVHRRVEPTLLGFAGQRGWLVTGRQKDTTSLSDKIETGRYRSLSEMDDLLAYSIIVDTRSQLRDALALIRKSFTLKSIRGKSTLNDERVFDFDATRVYATLNLSEKGSPLSQVVFEIQLKTILQYAWSKVTHPIVYKPRFIDSRKVRLSSEILASLEGLDRSFSTFSTSARSVKVITNGRSKRINEVITMVDRLVESGDIPSLSRPKNGKRFAENIIASVDTSKIAFDKALGGIQAFYILQAPHFPLSVSLGQLAVVHLRREGVLRTAQGGKPRYYYITPELVSLFPDVAKVTSKVEL